MELIVAVYDDWGIGRDGTQPVALNADRSFFREQTKGATVIVGRRTAGDFPGGRPLPGRTNILLSRTAQAAPGFTVAGSPEEAMEMAQGRVMVIGGESVYRQMLPYCDTAFVTKVHCVPESDTFFPDLDADPQWELAQILETGVENGVGYQMCLYKRKQ